jgi:tetratricopeptide (TPR) repeat protein
MNGVRSAGRVLAKRSKWRLAKIERRLRDEAQRLDALQLGDLEVRRSFALSHDDLSDSLRGLFRRLTLLPGSDFGPEVVAALQDRRLDVIEDMLERLVDAQLLEMPSEDRYRFHDLIGVFARERARIDDSAQSLLNAAGRARAWYLERASAADNQVRPIALQGAPSHVTSPAERSEALAWLTLERRNLIAAVEQAFAADDWATASRLAGVLTQFFSLRGHWDDWRRAQELALEAARAAGNRQAQANALNELGIVYGKIGRRADAISCHDASGRIMRELDDRHGVARALGNLATAYMRQGLHSDALACLEEHLKMARRLNDRHGEAGTLANLGLMYTFGKRWDDAQDSFTQSRQIMRELRDRRGEAESVSGQGILHAQQEDWDAAIGYYNEHLVS